MTHNYVRTALPIALFAVFALTGCGHAPQQPAAEKTSEHEHPHAEKGPHQGLLIELGAGEYHAELAHDDTTKTVTAYLLDKEAKIPVPIPATEIVLNLVTDGQPLQAKLAAAPQEGDPPGQASRFSIIDEIVLEAHDAPKTTGRLNVTINGKTYSGLLENSGHHAHKH
jgi:hypothetical protein